MLHEMGLRIFRAVIFLPNGEETNRDVPDVSLVFGGPTKIHGYLATET